MKQWYSAQELVGVAGLSGSIMGIHKSASQKGWPSQTRPGSAKEKEYAYASPPTMALAPFPSLIFASLSISKSSCSTPKQAQGRSLRRAFF